MIYPSTPPIVFSRISSTSKLPTRVKSWMISTHRLRPMLKNRVLKKPLALLATEIKKPYGTKIRIFPARFANTNETLNGFELPEFGGEVLDNGNAEHAIKSIGSRK